LLIPATGRVNIPRIRLLDQHALQAFDYLDGAPVR
jgi:hypothetical protein